MVSVRLACGESLLAKVNDVQGGSGSMCDVEVWSEVPNDGGLGGE